MESSHHSVGRYLLVDSARTDINSKPRLRFGHTGRTEVVSCMHVPFASTLTKPASKISLLLAHLQVSMVHELPLVGHLDISFTIRDISV